MKKFTLLTASLAGLMMLGANTVSAQLNIPTISYSIATNHNNPDVKIFDCGAKFNLVSGFIGWTGEDTKVELGEVDFGTDGNKFKASSIELANGWFCDGWAILHAGPSYEESVPFTQMGLNETGGYDNFVTYAANFACNTSSDSWSNGPAMEGISYTKPTGKQNVYLTFIGGAGNIRSINFYEQELTAKDFVRNLNDDGTPSYDDMIALLSPDQYEGYGDVSIRIMSAESVALNPDEFPDARLDGESWGWTGNGFMADYGNVDFGNGDYKQIVLNLTHWSENLSDYMEVYLDAVEEGNMIAKVWAGRNLEGKVHINLAKNLKAINGTHRVICKWIGGSINLKYVEFVKQAVWPIATECGVQIEDVEPAADAFHMTFENCPEGYGNPWGYTVWCKGVYESAGNIGYTKNGTVIEFYDENGDGVDFGDGSYKRIIVNHACDKTYAGPIEQSNFSFYIDLDPEFIYTPEDFDQNLSDILADHEPICVVRLQGTGNWATRKKTAGQIVTPVSGKHNLFMVYNNTYADNAGANVFDIYMDTVEPAGVESIVNDKANNVNVYTAEGEVIVNAEIPTTVDVFSLNGQHMTSVAVNGEASIEMARGFYLLRATNAEGVTAFKVIVK